MCEGMKGGGASTVLGLHMCVLNLDVRFYR